MRILVTGGAGYIGSFMTRLLLDGGNVVVVVVDSLERGQKDAVDKRAKLLVGNLLDKSFILDVLSEHIFDVIFHFAAYISMEESVKKPQMYFENNVFGTRNMLDAMVKTNVKNIVFSSTAGVYGNPKTLPIPEDHPKNPTNPYGESKLKVEEMLEDYQKTDGINFVSLRYFNAAGAVFDGSMGENHFPETHLIPKAIYAALNNKEFFLYGNDYNTSDKTCIRDYIHVIDLIEAHVLALKKLQKEKGGFFYNVGTGIGYSNREVIDMVKKISGVNFAVKIQKRRPGDASVLIADPSKIKNELGFNSKYSDLRTIVQTAWEWHKKLKMKNEKFAVY